MIKAVINETETKKIVAKFHETNIWFFEKISTISKTLVKLVKQKREKAQINKMRNEEEITTHKTEIQKKLREY